MPMARLCPPKAGLALPTACLSDSAAAADLQQLCYLSAEWEFKKKKKRDKSYYTWFKQNMSIEVHL